MGSECVECGRTKGHGIMCATGLAEATPKPKRVFYTQAEMDAALTTARREQREANAEIAKSMAKNWARMVGAPFSNSSHYSGLADGASQVAAAIREQEVE